MQAGRRLLTEIYPPELLGTLWVRAAKDSVGRIWGDNKVDITWQVDEAAQDTTKHVALAAYRIVVEAVAMRLGMVKPPKFRLVRPVILTLSK